MKFFTGAEFLQQTKTRKKAKKNYLELDCFEEDEQRGAGVVLHVVVQTKRLQEKHQWREC